MNSFIRKILKESDIFISTLAEYIPDLGKNLGSGINGTAWKYHGKVFKITSSRDEAGLSWYLLNHKGYFNRYSIIYSVEKIILDNKETNYYAIIKEYIEPVSNEEYNILKEIADDYYEERIISDDEKEQFALEFGRAKVNRLREEFLELCKRLERLKIYDLFPKNLGRKNGHLTAFDGESDINFLLPKNLPSLYVESNMLSESILKEAYWGTIGGGALIYCKSTNRFLIGLRSQDVEEPGTWGTFGGKLDIDEGVNETIIEAVKRELEEEISYTGTIEFIPAYVFKDKDFEYHNFIGVVQSEFKPILDWENDDAQWMTFEELTRIKNKHFGLVALLKHSMNLIKDIIKKGVLKEKEMGNFKPLPLEFLEALNNYVLDGRNKIKNKKIIEKYSKFLPENFKIAPSVIYRGVKINGAFESFNPGIRSFAKTLNNVYGFIRDNFWDYNQNPKLAIIKIETDPKRVILNLDSLIKSSIYKQSCEYYRDQNPYLGISINHSEGEIFYNQPKITKKDFYQVYDNQKDKWIDPNIKIDIKQQRKDKQIAIQKIIDYKKRLEKIKISLWNHFNSPRPKGYDEMSLEKAWKTDYFKKKDRLRGEINSLRDKIQKLKREYSITNADLKNIKESVLKEWNDALPNTTEQMSNEYSDYINEKEYDWIKAEVGSIPGGLNEIKKLITSLYKSIK